MPGIRERLGARGQMSSSGLYTWIGLIGLSAHGGAFDASTAASGNDRCAPVSQRKHIPRALLSFEPRHVNFRQGTPRRA